MKRKNIESKLVFNKHTVAVLTNSYQDQVLGGVDIQTRPCSLNKTGCDLFTNCYALSRCATVCGGPYC